jgi:single-strand DNA-binding protein
MQLFNFVFITGNMTDDPDLSYTPSGTAKLSFSIGHNTQFTDQKTKEVKKHSSFFSCIAWAKTAEFIAKFAKKGQLVTISGTLKQDRWEGKTDKQMHSAVRIIVAKFQLGPESGHKQFAPDVVGDAPAEQIPAEEDQPEKEDSERIPF